MERFELERSRYEGPTGIVGVLQAAFTQADIPAASLWAAVPGYAAQLPSPKAAMALVERACSMMGTPAPLSVLADQSAEYDARIASLVADDDDLSTYVSRLESMLDEPDLDPIRRRRRRRARRRGRRALRRRRRSARWHVRRVGPERAGAGGRAVPARPRRELSRVGSPISRRATSVRGPGRSRSGSPRRRSRRTPSAPTSARRRCPPGAHRG